MADHNSAAPQPVKGFRLGLALRCWWRVLTDPFFAGRVRPILDGKEALPTATPTPALPPKPAAPPKPTGEALRLLTLLQREGRLVDFLMEDIAGLPDEQIGA